MISKFWKIAIFFFVEHAHGKDIILANQCDDLSALKENNTIYGLEGVFDSDRAPSGWETKYKSHTPNGQMLDSSTVAVHVPHGMGPDHYITTIWIEDNKTGELLGCKKILSKENPKVIFYIQGKVEYIIPYEHCSLHGVWKGDIIDRFEESNFTG